MPDPQPLFRPAALQANRADLLGSVLLSAPPSLRVLVGVALALVLALIAFFSFGAYSSQVTLYGELVPDRGLILLPSPQAGTVIELRARAGDQVRRGDVLMVLSGERWSDPPSPVHERVAAVLEDRHEILRAQKARLIRLEQREQAALQDTLTRLHDQQALLEATLDLQQQRVAQLMVRTADHERLAAGGHVSTEQERAVRDQLIEQRARAYALEGEVAAVALQAEQLDHDLTALPLRYAAQRAELDLALAGLAQEQLENDWRRRFTIVAPVDGVLLQVGAETAQVVGAQTPLVTMMPAGAKLQVHLLAPESAVWSVSAGDRLRLRFDAFPYQRFGHHSGRVIEVSDAPGAASPEQAMSQVREGMASLYRVTVALDSQQVRARGREVALKSGMRVQARVATERRRLLAWAFRRS